MNRKLRGLMLIVGTLSTLLLLLQSVVDQSSEADQPERSAASSKTKYEGNVAQLAASPLVEMGRGFSESDYMVLRRELADVKAELATLKRRVDSASGSVPVIGGAFESPSQDDIQAAGEQSQRVAEEGAMLLRRQLASIDADFQSEATDSNWSVPTLGLIQATLRKAHLDGVSLVQAECRATMCRLAFEEYGSGDLESALFPKLAGTLPQVVRGAVDSSDPSGRSPSVYYLKRRPFSAPDDGST